MPFWKWTWNRKAISLDKGPLSQNIATIYHHNWNTVQLILSTTKEQSKMRWKFFLDLTWANLATKDFERKVMKNLVVPQIYNPFDDWVLILKGINHNSLVIIKKQYWVEPRIVNFQFAWFSLKKHCPALHFSECNSTLIDFTSYLLLPRFFHITQI